jgi:ATP-dependent Lhr-like helicase
MTNERTRLSLSERSETPLLPDIFARWFAQRGWAPRAHQLELLAKARDGRSVLLIAPTGGGKTLAGFLPTLVELHALYLSPRAGRGKAHATSRPLHPA